MSNGVVEDQAAAHPIKILRKTREILHSNLILFLQLSDYYRVAELKEIVENAMIEIEIDSNSEVQSHTGRRSTP